MGLAASFIGLRGVDRARVLEVLGATETGEEVLPYDAPLVWGEQNEGWLVLVSLDWYLPSPERLSQLSQGGEAVACQIEEHVMGSAAWGYEDGAQVWSLDYDCEKSSEVAVSGDPPSVFAEIYEKAKREQAAETEPVDYIFDVPAEVFSSFTGYRYDQDATKPFTELRLPAKAKPKRVGLFGLLFGRGSS